MQEVLRKCAGSVHNVLGMPNFPTAPKPMIPILRIHFPDHATGPGCTVALQNLVSLNWNPRPLGLMCFRKCAGSAHNVLGMPNFPTAPKPMIPILRIHFPDHATGPGCTVALQNLV